MKKDLIVLVADSNMENLFEGLLNRVPIVSHTRRFSFDIRVNPLRDAGNRNDCHEFLRPFINNYFYAIVVFDKEGCGDENTSTEEISTIVKANLENNGWNERCAVIIIEPEIENWIWVNSPNVATAIRWNKAETLYEWAYSNGWLSSEQKKPERPKEAFEDALKTIRMPRSASIYKKIGETVSYKKCKDAAFKYMLEILKVWFHRY